MLPKSKRLNLKEDFKRVAAGKKLETRYLKLFIAKQDQRSVIKPGDNGIAKVGIANSGRTFLKAVLRNRARRLASSAFEALYSKLPDNINIVALPKTGILKVKSSDVLLDLEEGLRKGGII